MFALRVVLLAHLLAASFVGAGAAQVRPVRLATRPGNVHPSQNTALLPDGRFATVWTRGRTAFLQYVDSNGAVAFGASGRAVATAPVTGAEAVVAEGTDFNHVTAQRMSAAGERLWGEGVSVLPSRPPHTLYDLFVHPDGGAVVAVLTFPFDFVSGGVHLVLQRLAADGRPLWPAEGVTAVDLTSSPDSVYEGPVVGSVDDGVLRIAWERSHTKSRRSEIRFSAFDAAGNRLTPSDGVPLVRPVVPRDASPLRGFAFDPASGTSFVVWEDSRGAAALLYAPR